MKEKMAEFLVALRIRGLSPRTIQYRRWTLSKFEGTGFDLARFFPLLPSDPSCRQQTVSTVRQFLFFAGRKDEARELKLPRVPSRPPLRPPSSEEVKKLLLSCDGTTRESLRDRAILELMYSSGLRCCEATTLEVSDLDLERGTVRLLGKGKKERMVPVGKAAAGWLTRYLAEGRQHFRPRSEALFLTRFGKEFSPTGLGYALKRVMKRAGFGPKLTAHGLRRAAAAHSMKAGMNLREVQELLGHAKIATTVRYTGLAAEELREALERFHPRAKMAPPGGVAGTDYLPTS